MSGVWSGWVASGCVVVGVGWVWVRPCCLRSVCLLLRAVVVLLCRPLPLPPVPVVGPFRR